MDDVLAGSRVFSDSCIFCFYACVLPSTALAGIGASSAVQTWVDVELRVLEHQVAVNIKNPNRPWLYNLGPQQKSTFLTWIGILKGGLGSFRGCCAWAFGQN